MSASAEQAAVRPVSHVRAAKVRFSQAVRRFLAKKGFALSHIIGATTENLEFYLDGLRERGVAIRRVHVLDSDQDPLRILLGVFADDAIHCCGRPNPPALPPRVGRDSGLLVEIDALALMERGSAVFAAQLEAATVVVVRAQIGVFWSGQGDVIDVVQFLQDQGFFLYDALRKPVSGLSAPNDENVYLAFERVETPADRKAPADRDRRRRIFETLNRLSVPIIAGREAVRLAGRGSFGLEAGLCNPGAVQTPPGLFLLARGETTHWHIQKHRWGTFVGSCRPMLLRLHDDLSIAQAIPLQLENSGAAGMSRTEDFRLFLHQGKVFANHSLMKADPEGPLPEPVVPEKLHTSICVSQLDLEPAALKLLGAPRLNRPVGRMEKNWAMFSGGGSVRLIYSFNPFRLFVADGFPDLSFRCVMERLLRLPYPEDGMPLRNSINPVPYDPEHFLHIVHRPTPSKPYVFWAVLIDAKSWLPVKMSRRPLFRGGARAGATIIYLSSAVVDRDEVTLFGGIDDSSIGVWKVTRSDLDREWQPIHV